MQGDPEQVFTALYERSYGAVLSYARRRVGEQEARDATAEVFLVAWRRLGDVPEEPLPWLLRTARLTLANQDRGARRGGLLAARVAAVDPPPVVADHAEEVASRHAVAALLVDMIPRDRELLMLMCWDGLDIAGAAHVLGCSSAVARVRLHRARRRFAARLAGSESLERAALGLGLVPTHRGVMYPADEPTEA